MFLMPSTAMACGNSNSKHSCEKKFHLLKRKKRVVVIMIIQKIKTIKVVKATVVIQNVDVLQLVLLLQ